MIQTATNIRSDIQNRMSQQPLSYAPARSYPPGTCPQPVSSGSSNEGSYRTAPSMSSYSQEIRTWLDTDLKNQGCFSTARPKDRNGDRAGLLHCRERTFGSPKERRRFLEQAPAQESTFRGIYGDQRQHAWSPPPKHEASWVRTGSDLGVIRHHSEDGRDVDEEDSEFVSPPRIMPVSGRIPLTVDHPILRPIPFKPIVLPSASCKMSRPKEDSCQSSSLDRPVFADVKQTTHNTFDDGYASHDWQNLSSSSSVSQNSFHGAELNSNEQPRSSRTPSSADLNSFRRSVNTGGTESVERNSERSLASRQRRRGLSFTQTPSPSDSGVGELEVMLREKETELQMLRETMERNELAMMQVFDEKRQSWEAELSDVVQDWQLKLRSHQQKSFRTEQSLMLQIFKLQQDNKNLRQNLERAGCESSVESHSLEQDLQATRTQLEELMWEQRQMTSEIDVLKLQLKNALEEASNKSMELISAQLQLKDSEMEIESKNAEIHRLLMDSNQVRRDLTITNEQKLNLECRLKKLEADGTSTEAPTSPLEALKVELKVTQKELEELQTTLDRERDQWFEEKTKVINYQKHLQLNYIQMARKNKMLEVEVQQMSSELERHDADCHLATTEESFC